MDCQSGFKWLTALLHLRRDRPIFLWFENLDFAFALDNQPKRNRLHAARRLGARQFAPQHRRQGKADKIVQRPACAIGVDQILVQSPRAGHGFGHGGLCNRIESHPVDLLRKRLLVAENLLNMPADGFAFTVRVSGEDQSRGFF